MSIVNFNSRKRLIRAKRPTPIFHTINTEFEKTSFPDLIDELSRNSHLYVVDSKSPQSDWITIYQLPLSISHTLKFLRPKITKDRPPGLRTFICMCLTFGIEIFNQNENVQSMILCNEKMFKHDRTSQPEETFIVDFLEQPVSIQSTERGKRINIPVTEWIKHSLSDMHDKLGIDVSTLAVMCVYSYLVTQIDHIPEAQLDPWIERLNAYVSVIGIKASGIEMMMAKFYGY